MLELALTVFVWGLVPGGALVALYTIAALDSLGRLARARAENEKRLH